METSIRSDTTHQPSICSTASTCVVTQLSAINQQVIDQFAQMKPMLTSFLGPRQKPTRTAFCNYLASEVENLEEREFQTFRNDAVKFVGYRAGHRKGTVSHSKLHFLGAPVPLPHMCQRLISSNSQQPMPRNTS